MQRTKQVPIYHPTEQRIIRLLELDQFKDTNALVETIEGCINK